MLRYVALTWVPDYGQGADLATDLVRRLQSRTEGWQTALHRDGLWVLYTRSGLRTDDVHPLPSGDGVVVGHLFHRESTGESAPPVRTITAEAGSAILRSGGRWLLDNCWGCYVAFLRDTRSGGVQVLRDPTGTLPCYTTTHGRIRLFFSKVDDLVDIGLGTYSVNWDYLKIRLTGYFECAETGLNEVSQVVGGERFDCNGPETMRTLLWNPHDIAHRNILEDPGTAATALRQTVRTCVRTWESIHDGILMRLSGGIDSSIVLSCLSSDAGSPRVTAVNYYSPGARGDERPYARLVAAKCGFPLIEQERNPDARFDRIFQLSASPRPWNYFAEVQDGGLEPELARRLDATGIFTGGGGDQVLYQFRAAFPAADYAHVHGLRPGLTLAALETARLSNTSVWNVLGEAVIGGLLHRPRSTRSAAARGQHPLVHSQTLETTKHDPRFTHPALRKRAGTPPGKLLQLSGLLVPPEYYGSFGSDADPGFVNPLLSQPVIELCLRIPTYVLALGGIPRGLARRAFAGELPQEIVHRRTKGSGYEYGKSLLARNRELLRQTLLDGELVKHGLLSRAALLEALSDQPTRSEAHSMELFDFLGIEAWVQRWAGERRRSAA